MRLLLASKSTARRRMLEQAGVPYELVDAMLDEDAAKAELRSLCAADLAAALAERKAKAPAASEGDLVLGSDQTLETHEGALLSKPRSPEDLRDQLRSLSGKTHRLHAAAVIVTAGEAQWHAVQSVAMTVRPLSEGFIHTYVEAEYEAVRWSVGGYHVEGRGAQLFERIEGSHFAVLGMPLLPLLTFLREKGVLTS